jgi:proline iminopeptidase
MHGVTVAIELKCPQIDQMTPILVSTSGGTKIRVSVAALAALFVSTALAEPQQSTAPASELRVAVDHTSLHVRVTGRGQPLIVLHGGPDFDTAYLLPELDQLADAHRLIYYDQRGRGRSAEGVRPEDVTFASDLADLDMIRTHFKLESSALLGHSWGSVLALEYALRNPSRVSRLILMNPAPISASQLVVLRKSYVGQLGSEMERQREITASAAYKSGDPEAVAARYRIHFSHGLRRAADYDTLMARMSAQFRAQGASGILKAWAIESRLYRDTWDLADYDLLPKLRTLRTPTLVIVGEHDFIPPEIAAQIASALPNATLATIKDCGHFAYLECGSEVRKAIDNFFSR